MKTKRNRRRPNFLVLLPDQHRGDWMPGLQAEGPLPLRMPNVRRLMTSGVTFTRAVTPSPLCAPARACLASGLRYHRCGVAGNGENYPLNQKTYYSVLREAGYTVGGVGKFDLHKATRWWGLDGWIADLRELGFTCAVDNAGKWDAVDSGAGSPKDPYMRFLHDRGLAEAHVKDMNGRRGGRERQLNTNPTPLPEEAYCDNWVTGNALAMLGGFSEDAPWHLAVNFVGPHDPWDVTKRMRREWEDVAFPGPVGSDDVQNGIRQNYAASLENIDRNIGKIIDTVEKRGELQNTVILYTSDHGEMLGDFGCYGKSNPHRGSVTVPLVMSGPGIHRGVVSDALVELQDLARTVAQIAGCRMPEARDSLSLLPVITGDAKRHREFAVSALSDGGCRWRMIMDERHKLVEDGEPVLYDLDDDPWETRPLLSHPAADRLARRLRSVWKGEGTG